MEQLGNEILAHSGDPQIDAILRQAGSEGDQAELRLCCAQNEEYFLRLPQAFSVPSLPIHHDYRSKEAGEAYMEALRPLVGRLAELAPGAFSGLCYFFDPAEVFKPCFFRVYKAAERLYLYLLRLDLMPKRHYSRPLGRGDNDSSPAYESESLFFEADIVPLEAVDRPSGTLASFKLRQLLSDTLIEETGRGYMLRGVWMDGELTKYFSRLFAPRGSRLYPFYPITCKYRTVCAFALDPGTQGRREGIAWLHRAITTLEPELPAIQAELRSGDFDESLPSFERLYGRVRPEWRKPFEGITVEARLNDAEMREYELRVDRGN
jgi:hypothetical protein